LRPAGGGKLISQTLEDKRKRGQAGIFWGERIRRWSKSEYGGRKAHRNIRLRKRTEQKQGPGEGSIGTGENAERRSGEASSDGAGPG